MEGNIDMKTLFARTSLPLWPVRLVRLMPMVALLGAALLAASPARAAPSLCPGPGRINVPNYNFSYLSRRQGSGSTAAAFNCVHNYHASRGVFIEWRNVGLRTTVPPNQDAFVTNPTAGHTATVRPYRLYYGARPSYISVQTWASADGLTPGLGGSAFRFVPFRRAAYWQGGDGEPEAPAVPGAGSAALVYIPVDPSFLAGFAGRPLTPRRLIEWLESNPGQLRPFGATFESRPTGDAAGRSTIVYELRYRMPALARSATPLFYLRFSNRALQRLIFERLEPFPIAGASGEETVLRAVVPAPGDSQGRAIVCIGRLDILLGDGRTVIASLPVTYSALPGS